MLKGACLVAGLLLVLHSAEPLFHYATNRQQITVTCEAFAQSPPSARWLRITGCEVDYLGAGVRERNGRIVELYFPARPASWAPTHPAPLVAATTDPGVLALAEATMGGGRTPDQEQFLVMMLKIVTALRAAREIEGYGRASVVERAKTRAALSDLSSPLAADAAIIDLHARPSLLGPAAATAAGVLLLGMLVVLRSKRRGRPKTPLDTEGANQDDIDAPDAVPAAFASPPPGPPLRLMLLNLPNDAGREAIEHAPPLGSRADVIAALTDARIELQFDACGRAAFERPDVQVTFDLGPTDPVYTVVVHARGAALPILREMLERTGWRAFDAKNGAFVSIADSEAADVRPLDHTAA